MSASAAWSACGASVRQITAPEPSPTSTAPREPDASRAGERQRTRSAAAPGERPRVEPPICTVVESVFSLSEAAHTGVFWYGLSHCGQIAVGRLHTSFVMPLLTWLIQGAVGPALVGLPVTWAASDVAGAARRWFRRRRHSDGLSRIVRAATGGVADLSTSEFAAVRRLLEQESTWKVAGRGTVEDLAARIASCLTGRSDKGSLAAGRAIAGGLLEFVVCDLEPEWFQQVLFSRLDRLQTDQARALDEAMAAVHADLAAITAYQHAAAAGRFNRLMGQLGWVLDRLPGPADQRQVAVYLAVLAR